MGKTVNPCIVGIIYAITLIFFALPRGTDDKTKTTAHTVRIDLNYPGGTFIYTTVENG